MTTEAAATLDHLFRHEYGRLVSLFTNRYSTAMIDSIEDAVQEALYKAAKVWAFKGLPENPQAWLYRVANNALIDSLRKTNRVDRLDDDTKNQVEETQELEFAQDELGDEQLRMIFACCHPSMKLTEQLMLSLKLLCGLSVKEISRALLKQEEATKKAITRAKKKFKEEIGKLEVPVGNELESRLSAVLQVIYLLFNEGYKATEGERLLRQDLCDEAIRLAFLLKNEPSCDNGELQALISMMLFKAARFPARVDAKGRLLTLAEQDRSKYDEDMMQWGWKFLKESSAYTYSSIYQLEATISCYYTTAETYEKTNWQSILGLYDRLIALKPAPVVHMSRILVLSKLEGAQYALNEIEKIEDELKGNQSFNALKADLYADVMDWPKARLHLQRAISESQNFTERRFLQDKLRSWVGR